MIILQAFYLFSHENNKKEVYQSSYLYVINVWLTI